MARNRKRRRPRKKLPFAIYESQAHMGSKRGYLRLPVTIDSQGKRHIKWPRRPRRGRQTEPMAAADRLANYFKTNGAHRLTPAQRSRARHKIGAP